MGRETSRLSGVPVHAVASSKSPSAAQVRACVALARRAAVNRTVQPLIRAPLPVDLDLFGRGRLDQRAVAQFDPSPDTKSAAFQIFQIDPRCGEVPPIPFEHGHGKIARPSPPEIYIYCGPALPDRQDLALDKGKPTPHRRNAGKIV